MIGRKHKGRLDNANYWNVRLSIFLALAIVAIVILAALVYRLATRDRLHVAPPTITKPYWVEDDKASASYLEQMSDYYRFLGLDVSHENVDAQHKQFLKHVDPQVAGDMEAEFKIVADKIKKDQAKTIFSVRDVVVDEANQRVAYIGSLSTIIGRREVANDRKAYLFAFRYSRGRLLIKEFHETDEHDPFGTKTH